MGLKLITAPTSYPLTLAEARAQCRIDETDTSEDSYLTALIAAATSYVEDMTGRALISQVWELYLDAFSASIMIPKGPVTAVASVKYYDTDGALQTVDADDYTIDLVSDPQWIVPIDGFSWPTTAIGINKVIVRFTAGYSTLPPAIVHTLRLLVSTWYDQRAGTSDKPITETPHAVAALLANHRIYAF